MLRTPLLRWWEASSVAVRRVLGLLALGAAAVLTGCNHTPTVAAATGAQAPASVAPAALPPVPAPPPGYS